MDKNTKMKINVDFSELNRSASNMYKGNVVNIYHNPLEQENIEGKAVLIEFVKYDPKAIYTHELQGLITVMIASLKEIF